MVRVFCHRDLPYSDCYEVNRVQRAGSRPRQCFALCRFLNLLSSLQCPAQTPSARLCRTLARLQISIKVQHTILRAVGDEKTWLYGHAFFVKEKAHRLARFFIVVRSPRLELGRVHHTPLKRTRLPIPPWPLKCLIIIWFIDILVKEFFKVNYQKFTILQNKLLSNANVLIWTYSQVWAQGSVEHLQKLRLL